MAAAILAEQGHETRYGGIDPEAPNPVKAEDVTWAEGVVFARKRHQDEFHAKFKVFEKEFVLEVSDDPAEIGPELAERRAANPNVFYGEYTYPRIRAALSKTFK